MINGNSTTSLSAYASITRLISVAWSASGNRKKLEGSVTGLTSPCSEITLLELFKKLLGFALAYFAKIPAAGKSMKLFRSKNLLCGYSTPAAGPQRQGQGEHLNSVTPSNSRT